MTLLRRRSPETPLTIQKMASQSYDPQDDWRRCITARLVPLDTITNIDMTGVMVGVAGGS